MLEFSLGHILDAAIETWHEEEQHKVGREEPILLSPNGEQGIEPRLERDRIAEAEMREEQHRDSPKHCRYPQGGDARISARRIDAEETGRQRKQVNARVADTVKQSVNIRQCQIAGLHVKTAIQNMNNHHEEDGDDLGQVNAGESFLCVRHFTASFLSATLQNRSELLADKKSAPLPRSR